MTTKLALCALCLCGAEPGAWPAFRGDGTSRTNAELPLTWSADENVCWKTALRGYGQSSPVVWDGKAFVTSIEGRSKETLIVAAFEVESGDQLWEQTLPASQTTAFSDYVSKAAPTPAVDAERLYVFFESGDLAAFDHAGNVLWQRDLTADYGPFQGNHGIGSSLALAEGKVVVLVDHSGPSYLMAVDPATGRTLWKTDREPRVAWSSPIVTPGPEPQILVSSNGTVEAFSAADGSRLWIVKGIDGNTVPSPTASDETVFIGSNQTGQNLAIRRDGRGDVTETHVAWRAPGVSSSFASPLYHEGRVYYVNRAGAATCLDAKTGDELWTARLPGSCWATPIGAGERIYFFTKEGPAVVVRASDKFERLAENQLDSQGRVYGVAITGGRFLVRTGRQMICLGK